MALGTLRKRMAQRGTRLPTQRFLNTFARYAINQLSKEVRYNDPVSPEMVSRLAFPTLSGWLKRVSR